MMKNSKFDVLLLSKLQTWNFKKNILFKSLHSCLKLAKKKKNITLNFIVRKLSLTAKFNLVKFLGSTIFNYSMRFFCAAVKK